MSGISPDLRERVLRPPVATASWPGIGGRIRCRPEDFRVEEIDAYPADGREERHLLVRFEKRSIPTDEAVRRLCRWAKVPMTEAGVPGRKDADAVTVQRVSLPWAARAALEDFDDPQVRLLEVRPHGQKLRLGHLRGNRFAVVVRGLAVGIDEAQERVRAKLGALRAGCGLENLYGPQRFGPNGRNLDRGLRVLGGRRIDRRDLFLASAAQAAVFNLYVVRRRLEGLDGSVLEGDVLQKVETGGMFDCEDPTVDAERWRSGELVVTGPLPGARMRAPAPGTASARFEDGVLDAFDLGPGELARHGKRLPGTRRAAHLRRIDLECAPSPAVDGLDPGLALGFELPAGSFATQLLRELQVGPDTHEEDPWNSNSPDTSDAP